MVPDLRDAVRRCIGVVLATVDVACCYKPNAAFWEQYGPDGWRGLRDVREEIPSDIPVVLDAKRADVAPTMHAYAVGIFEALRMDAATVHAYHGTDSVQEFTRYADRGVYVVCHTTNPGRRDLQHLESRDRPIYVRVGEFARRLNITGNVGLVVGATGPAEAAVLREAFPELPFLLPGVGRQGGDVAASVRASWNDDPASCIVSVSSAIMMAQDPKAEAVHWRDEIAAAVPRTA